MLTLLTQYPVSVTRDFGDRYPNAQVIGNDVSNIQPAWLPPNVYFEIDDVNAQWVHTKGFDFIHARMMNGSITDWAKFYREAFRSCNPGGWMESHEASFKWRSETTEIPENSAMGQWNQVFWEGGKKFGRTFRVVDDGLQQKLMEEAGFVDVVAKDIKVAFGDWPRDRQMKAAGRWAKMTLMSDLEGKHLYDTCHSLQCLHPAQKPRLTHEKPIALGYLLYMWNAVMGWTPTEVTVFSAHLRHQLKQPNLNPYFIRRVVYGRKPE